MASPYASHERASVLWKLKWNHTQNIFFTITLAKSTILFIFDYVTVSVDTFCLLLLLCAVRIWKHRSILLPFTTWDRSMYNLLLISQFFLSFRSTKRIIYSVSNIWSCSCLPVKKQPVHHPLNYYKMSWSIRRILSYTQCHMPPDSELLINDEEKKSFRAHIFFNYQYSLEYYFLPSILS